MISDLLIGRLAGLNRKSAQEAILTYLRLPLAMKSAILGLPQEESTLLTFDRSRQLELKPGAQGAVALPPTVCRPPPGITHLDPYSWDIYCVGTLLLWYLRVCVRNFLAI